MAEVKYLTIKDIEEINKEIVKKYGGTSGFHSKGNLEFALSRMKNAQGILKKAAILMYGINTGHVFWDANKRTAFDATLIFLRMNGIDLQIEVEEAEEVLIKMAQPKGFGIKETEEWIKKYAVMKNAKK